MMEKLFFGSFIVIFIIAWVFFIRYYRYKKNEPWLWSVFAGGVFSCVVVFVCLISFIVIIYLLDPELSTEKNIPPSSSEIAAQKEAKENEVRNELIERSFSAWDGSHRKLEKYIKESMNDPNSYEHIETRYWDRGDYLVVMTTFRGKNAFGGVVKNSIKAKVGLDGSIIDIIEAR